MTRLILEITDYSTSGSRDALYSVAPVRASLFPLPPTECEMIPIVAGSWFKIALSPEQVAALHVSRLEDAFGALFLAAASPPGAALFGFARDDGGEDLYFTPQAVAFARELLKANGGSSSDPPVDDGTVVLLVGHSADVRLLSS